MPMDHVACARRTIHHVSYITIATICTGIEPMPWNTPVYAAFDSTYDFFWISDQHSQHSRNIRRNPHAFLAIYDSTIPEGTGAGKGVYIQAHAEELSDPHQIARAHRLVAQRSGTAPRPADYYLGEMPGRIYRAAPQRLWVNDVADRGGLHVDTRVEVDLATLQGRARTSRDTR
jgi:uncharacterized protein YhbP (UPF0306 family)